MSEDGYLQLTDFGFAKQLGSDMLTKSYVGTPEYLGTFGGLNCSAGDNFRRLIWEMR